MIIAPVVYVICTHPTENERKAEVLKQAETITGITIQDPRWFYYGSSFAGFDFKIDNDWYYSVYITNREIKEINKTPVPGNHEGVVHIYERKD